MKVKKYRNIHAVKAVQLENGEWMVSPSIYPVHGFRLSNKDFHLIYELINEEKGVE